MKIYSLFFLIFQSAIWGYGVAIAASPTDEEITKKTPPASLKLTLIDAITLALRTNRTVKSAYMERVVQKFNLRVAEDKFNVDVNLNVAPTYEHNTDRLGDFERTTENTYINSSLEVVKQIETGAHLRFSWERGDRWFNEPALDTGRNDSNNWGVEFSQPLLKNAGIDVNTASVVLAQMADKSNLLSLKESVIGTVNTTILAFRSYARQARQVDINQASVKRARSLLAMNKVLISVGRMPANELIQSESALADQEFSLETSLNNLDSARLSLLKVLDLEWQTQITPVESNGLEVLHPEYDICLAKALENRTDYTRDLISLEQAKISLIQAENNMKWDLDFFGNYDVGNNRDDDDAVVDSENTRWDIGLRLSIPLYGDLTREQTLIRSKISLKQAKLNLEEVEQNIAIEVKDNIRNVETRLKQVSMAKRSRELSERKLEVEREKLKVGRTTNFQIVTFQNDLVRSQNAELDTTLAYLNALTTLDTTLGTTLDTWSIDYNKEDDKWPGK